MGRDIKLSAFSFDNVGSIAEHIAQEGWLEYFIPALNIHEYDSNCQSKHKFIKSGIFIGFLVLSIVLGKCLKSLDVLLTLFFILLKLVNNELNIERNKLQVMLFCTTLSLL